ncbi:MAG TPA: His/Gly/Thr/Pro-type tRNA ligase C-terminal domain-containing protein, partial [bacterium]|nr:His/Gly/Thr/Pro-type tRNA ligase C-terminal domain-containing protein [bacterium]
AGASRGVMASLVNAYAEEEAPTGDGKTETRVVMKFHPTLAPVKAAILPLVKKDGMPEVSMTLYNELKKHYKIFYDESATVGKRYRRQDEIGTPYCFTIDSETLQNQTVTVRHRDSMRQERIAMDQVLRFLQNNLNA